MIIFLCSGDMSLRFCNNSVFKCRSTGGRSGLIYWSFQCVYGDSLLHPAIHCADLSPGDVWLYQHPCVCSGGGRRWSPFRWHLRSQGGSARGPRRPCVWRHPPLQHHLDALDGQRPLPPVHIQVESLECKSGGNLLYVRCEGGHLSITEVV